ncbi:MAG: hypothetical protein WCD35_14350 [Mycobacteriales bacterium]
MHLVDVVLFLHIVAALAAFSVSTVIHVGEWSSRRATTVAELRAWAVLTKRLSPLFPVLIAILLGLGAWLLHLSGGEFRWSDGWVVAAVVALGVLFVSGVAVLDPTARTYAAALVAAPDGPVTPELRAASRNALPWTLGHLNTGLALAVVLNMTTKPAGTTAALVLVLGAGLGGLIGHSGARRGSAVAVPAGA